LKPVFLRAVAERFFETELDSLVDKGDEKTAAGMATALGKLKNAISVHPDSGSPSYANLLDLPGLRHRKLGRFAYLVFYFERDTTLDVWQILHAKMDILHRLRDPDAPAEVDKNDTSPAQGTNQNTGHRA
jgi:toxin ParE1/3/4